MNLTFVVERPTQFEAPLYRFAAADPDHRLRVIFTDPRLAAPVYDPELGRPVSWGFDLLAGYDHAVCPERNRRVWLARELRRAPCDLLIVNGYTQPAYLQAAFAARRARISTALRLDSVAWDGAPSHPFAKRLLFVAYLKRMYDLFFGVGTLTLDYLRLFGVPAERTALFPYAIDVEDFRRRSDLSAAERAALRDRLGVPPDARVLLSVAKLNPREGPWDLLHAFAREEAPDRWLLLAGDGPELPELEAFVRERGLARVRFLGYIPYPELPALYAAADLFIHAAREERWGVSVAEALACGLPVIASSRVGAGRDLLAAGRNGFVYPAGDAAALAARIDDALRLPPGSVREENRAILAQWDYAATWRGILRAAQCLTGKGPTP
jgi:glycosyltransferase involved in cell wall biosynthesis